MKRFQPLTADQRDKAQERSQERYDRIYSEVEDGLRAEWEYEYGTHCPSYPFKPDGSAIHAEAQRRVELEQRHDAEEAADALL